MQIISRYFNLFKYILIIIATFSLSAFSLNSNNEKAITKYSADLVGYIGKSPIYMHLKINETDNGDVKYSGYYTYVKIGRKIQLKGSWLMRPGTPTKIRITERVKGEITGEFELLPTSYSDYSTLKGEWFGNGKKIKVSLKKIQ